MELNTESINEKIYHLLRERIVFGEFEPGSRIEIKNLKQEFNVSPQPIKEAIFRLAGEGFITIFPRKGTYVREANLKDLVNMVEARIMYETGAIDLIGGQITANDLQLLDECCEDLMQTKDKTYKEIQKKNMVFHCAIVGLAKNQWWNEAHRLLMGHYAGLHFRYVIRKEGYSNAEQIYKDHRLIIDALRNGDSEEAKKVVKLHMQRVKDKIIKELFTQRQNNSEAESKGGVRSITALR